MIKGDESLAEALAWSVPTLLSTLAFLGLTRLFLLRRAFAAPRYRLRKMFHRLDGVFAGWNRRFGGIVFSRADGTLRSLCAVPRHARLIRRCLIH